MPGTNPPVGRNLEETPTRPSALIGHGEKEMLVEIVADWPCCGTSNRGDPGTNTNKWAMFYHLRKRGSFPDSSIAYCVLCIHLAQQWCERQSASNWRKHTIGELVTLSIVNFLQIMSLNVKACQHRRGNKDHSLHYFTRGMNVEVLLTQAVTSGLMTVTIPISSFIFIIFNQIVSHLMITLHSYLPALL